MSKSLQRTWQQNLVDFLDYEIQQQNLVDFLDYEIQCGHFLFSIVNILTQVTSGIIH